MCVVKDTFATEDWHQWIPVKSTAPLISCGCEQFLYWEGLDSSGFDHSDSFVTFSDVGITSQRSWSGVV